MRMHVDAQIEMLGNRVAKNRRRLRKWVTREGITSYRLYDRDIPEIPLAIDWYDGRLHVSEYRVKREPEAGWARAMAEGLAASLEVPAEQVYVKTRERQRGSEQYRKLGSGGERFTVSEGGYRFWVNLADYLDTGLFLDHRITRGMVGGEAGGRDVVNLFAYTGTFSVYAAGGGARSTTTVDLSKTYCTWAQDNLALNDIAGDQHRVIQADVLDWIGEQDQRFDLAVVDPPTFSNSKRMVEPSFDVQRDHVSLLRQVIDRLRPGGICYFSTNFRRFKLGDLDSPAIDAVRDITDETIPPDFRNRRIHSCYRIALAAGGG